MTSLTMIRMSRFVSLTRSKRSSARGFLRISESLRKPGKTENRNSKARRRDVSKTKNMRQNVLKGSLT